MEILIPILKMGLSLLVLAATASGALMHIAHRQSRSYIIALGYGLLTVYFATRLSELGRIPDIHRLSWPILLITVGEILRFYGMETRINKALRSLTHKNAVIYDFKDFMNLELDTPVEFMGSTVTKLQEMVDYLVLKVDYEFGQSANFEGEDFDCIYSVLNGQIIIVSKNECHTLTPGKEVNIKRGTPYSIKPEEKSSVKIIMMKRYEGRNTARLAAVK